MVKVRFKELVSSLINKEIGPPKREMRGVEKEVLEEVGFVGRVIVSSIERLCL